MSKLQTMTLKRILKRNRQIMLGILPKLTERYTIKFADEGEILLKLNNKDDIEIYMLPIVEPTFTVFVWKDEHSSCDNVSEVTEDKLIPLIDDILVLYGSGFYNRRYRETNSAWYKSGE